MFAVGDPKQSIYGFRHADVELFSSLLAADTSSQQLTINRRTRADVCAWINAVLVARFAQGDDVVADQQVAYTALDPQRSVNVDADGPGVVVLGMPGWSKLDHETAENTARAEAADIAALVQRVVGSEQPWHVGEDRRPASYRDITVLMRSRTRLGVLEHTLRQAGVPYRVEGGTLIYGSREVYELLRVLRAIDDPTNQLKVVTALRTSIFGIDDRQLMEYRLGPDSAPAHFPKDFRVFAKEAGSRRRRTADPRPVRPAQARAHARRIARRAVRQLARCGRGPLRRPAGCPRDLAQGALRDRRGAGVERRDRWHARRIPGLGRPAYRRCRSGRAEHRRGRGLAADHDDPRREGSGVPDHDRLRSRRCRCVQCRNRASLAARQAVGSPGKDDQRSTR